MLSKPTPPSATTSFVRLTMQRRQTRNSTSCWRSEEAVAKGDVRGLQALSCLRERRENTWWWATLGRDADAAVMFVMGKRGGCRAVLHDICGLIPSGP